jgi:hypothetical protein
VNRVLVVGLPRSGTTWVAHVLAGAGGATYLEEPDNHFRWAYAFRAKRMLGRREYPPLRPGDEVAAASELATLWRRAFTPRRISRAVASRRRATNRLVAHAGATRVSSALAGGSQGSILLDAASALSVPEHPPEGAQTLVVKSVYAPLCVEWIARENAVRVVIVVRDPVNVVSSWLELGWIGDRATDMLSALDPETAHELAERYGTSYPSSASPLARATWLAGVLTCTLEDVAMRNPDWPCVGHEDLCEEPSARFSALAARLRLDWTREAEGLLESMDRPGRGFEVNRVAKSLPEVWRTRLDADQARTIRSVLDGLPLTSR